MAKPKRARFLNCDNVCVIGRPYKREGAQMSRNLLTLYLGRLQNFTNALENATGGYVRKGVRRALSEQTRADALTAATSQKLYG